MDPNTSMLERLQVVTGFSPISMTSAQTGDVVSMKNYRRCLILFAKGIGTAGDDPTITLLQGTDVAFATNKALDFGTIYVKQDPTAINQVGQWTKVTRTVVAGSTNTYTDATSAEQEALWAIEVKAEDLDIANNYDCIRASIGDVGTNSQLGTILYILGDPVFDNAPENMASAIVD